MTDVFTETPATNTGEPKQEPTPTAAAPALDPSVAEFVGDGKKYSSVDDALKSIAFREEHVSTLERENAELRSEVDKRRGAEEILTTLQQSREPSTTTEVTKPTSETNSGISKDDVRAIINESKTDEQRANNVAAANAKAKELFGDKAKESVASRATELGMTVDSLRAVAETSPDAFVRLISSGKQESSPTATTVPSQNADSTVVHTNVESGTQQYYDSIRRQDPKKYWSREVQAQLHKDAQSNPNKFYGT